MLQGATAAVNSVKTLSYVDWLCALVPEIVNNDLFHKWLQN